MPRNQQPRQASNDSDRQPPGRDGGPKDREPERPEPERPELDDERIPNARKLRDDDGSYGGFGYDYDKAREYDLEPHLSRLPTRDEDDGEEPVAEADIMEVLDLDDLHQMEGPDA